MANVEYKKADDCNELVLRGNKHGKDSKTHRKLVVVTGLDTYGGCY